MKLSMGGGEEKLHRTVKGDGLGSRSITGLWREGINRARKIENEN